MRSSETGDLSLMRSEIYKCVDYLLAHPDFGGQQRRGEEERGDVKWKQNQLPLRQMARYVQ